MKAYKIIIISLLITVSYNLKYDQITLNNPFTFKSGDKSLQFFQLSLKDMKSLPNEIKI